MIKKPKKQIKVKKISDEKTMKQNKFSTFCKQHKIAEKSIKWRAAGDQKVKIDISKNDFESGKWSLMSVGIMFALRELKVNVDVVIRETDKDIEIILEK